MKLAKSTMDVLQSFATINPSILIQPGKTLRTIDAGSSIIGSAEIENEFDKEITIYDVPNFLQVLKMFDDPELDLGDADTDYCVITYAKEKTRVRMLYANKEAIDYIQKDVNTPVTEINFKLSAKEFSAIIKAANTMALNHLLIIPSGDNAVSIVVTDIDNSSSNTFKLEVPAELDGLNDFEVVFDMAKIGCMIISDYDVGISATEISHFSGEGIQYWVALNSHSKVK